MVTKVKPRKLSDARHSLLLTKDDVEAYWDRKHKNRKPKGILARLRALVLGYRKTEGAKGLQ